MDAAQTQLFDYIVRQGAVLGLAFVFLAGVLALLLWVAASAIGLLKKWGPAWFSSSIQMQKSVASSMRRLARGVFAMYRRHDATHKATIHLTKAMSIYCTKNRQKLGISSDVIYHIQEAGRTLEEEGLRQKQDLWQFDHDDNGGTENQGTEEEFFDDAKSKPKPDPESN
jgi:hypothetical protein